MTISTEHEFCIKKHEVICSIHLKKDSSSIHQIDTEQNNERNFRKAILDFKKSVKMVDNNEALFVILSFHTSYYNLNFEPCKRSQNPLPDIYRVMYFMNILKDCDERYSCTTVNSAFKNLVTCFSVAHKKNLDLSQTELFLKHIEVKNGDARFYHHIDEAKKKSVDTFFEPMICKLDSFLSMGNSRELNFYNLKELIKIYNIISRTREISKQALRLQQSLLSSVLAAISKIDVVPTHKNGAKVIYLDH